MSENGQSLQQTQSLRLRLTQQQIQFGKLLELNAPEFDERVESELESNPALDADNDTSAPAIADDESTPWYLRRAQNRSADDATPEFAPADTGESLYDHLRRQLGERELPPAVEAAAEYIIGYLDSNGWLTRTLPDIHNDLEFNLGVEIDYATLKEAFEVVRRLDPHGVGAENLRDCMLLQLKAMSPSQTRDDAINILTDYFEPYTMHHSHRIISGLKISQERVSAANTLITSLNPKPGAAFENSSHPESAILVPDFSVSNEEGTLTVGVNNRYSGLHIEQSYREAMQELKNRRGRNRKGREIITSNYNEAKNFIMLVEQRQQTLMTVMTAIVSIQKDYFESGDVYDLKPMMIKDISAMTGLNMPLISRATTNKSVQTPWGAVVPLRKFFSDSKGDGTNGETLTNRQIEAMIEAIVKGEDKRHPLSDDKIAQMLADKGYKLSRRAISKYRDRMGIAIARLRKEI